MSFKIPPGFLPDKWCANRPSDDATWPAYSNISTWSWTVTVLPSCALHSSWPWNCRGGPCGGGQDCPVLVTADSSWLCKGPTTCESGTHRPRVRHLCENILRKGQKIPKEKRQTWEGTQKQLGGNQGTSGQGWEQGDEGTTRSEELEVLHDWADVSPKRWWPTEGLCWSRGNE